MVTQLATFKIRTDTAANWTAGNRILLDGEMGIERSANPLTTAVKVKIGNGTLSWNSLPYFGGTGGSGGTGDTLSIGTITTGPAGSSASATITGTSPNKVLNLTIPRGDQGIQGIQGIQGPAGSGGTGSATPAQVTVLGSNNTLPAGAAPQFVLRTSDSSGGVGTAYSLSTTLELAANETPASDNTTAFVVRKVAS